MQPDGGPVDWRGRSTCAVCRKVGQAGDAQHPLDALPPTPDHVLEAEARRLGEGD